MWDLLPDSFELWRSEPVNGEGQLLSDVQILMLIGQIALHCNLSDSQQRHAVKEREWQEGFCRKKKNLEMLWFLMLSVLLIL